jgi:hypothetical protein
LTVRTLAAGASTAALVLAGALPLPARADEAADRQRYLELAKRKAKAKRLNELWKLEGELAAKRTAYAVLDLTQKKLYLKVRGRTFKAVTFTTLTASRRARPVDLDELAFRAFTLQLKEGKGRRDGDDPAEEPLRCREEGVGTDDDADAETSRSERSRAGAVESQSLSPEDAAAAAAASQKVAGVAGGAIPPDPPPKYHMGFDGDLSMWIVATDAASPKGARYEVRWISRGRSDG